MTAPVYLTNCAACAAYSENGGQVAMYAVEVPVQAPWYCRKCQPGLIPADEHAQEGEAIGLVDHSPEARWVVLARDGDTLTVRPLGLPTFPARSIPIAMVRPRFSYERLAQSRRTR